MFPRLSILSLLTTFSLVHQASATIIVSSTPTAVEAFNYGVTGPLATDWSTTSLTAATGTGSFAADGTTITGTRTTFDTQLALLAASDVTTALVVAAANGTNIKGKYISASNVGAFTSPHLATQATTTSWTGIVANLQVGGSSGLTGLSVVWNSAIDLAPTTGTNTDDANYNGHRLYYSIGGAANSFLPVADYLFASGSAVNSTAARSANIVFGSTVPVGTNIYIVWADDNATANADGAYAIDDVQFTGVPVPEPSALALAVLGLAAGLRRRR